jgi:hypothetical protein
MLVGMVGFLTCLAVGNPFVADTTSILLMWLSFCCTRYRQDIFAKSLLRYYIVDGDPVQPQLFKLRALR